MILFLSIASIMSLGVAWLLLMPIRTAEITRREKQKTAFFIMIATVMFPLTSYYLLTL